jgi:Carboxypeptidase regulatory-like domain/TonB dependent receptor-like, beta-barrel
MRMRASAVAVLSLCIAMLLAPVPARAQATTGTIEGQVKDQQGALLPGVTITATNTDTGGTSTTVTTEVGLFRLPYLPLGTYEVRAKLEGFRTEVRQGLVVGLNATVVVNFALAVGQIAEMVTVVGESPIVQSTKTEIGRTFDEKALLDRPLTIQVSGFAGRSVYNFATLAPGVTTPGPRFDRAFLGSGGSNVVANGTTARSSNFELDGISNIDPEDNDYRVPVSVEGVREFEVITSNYNAEFGRAGGAISRAVSKSGSNVFHGGAWEFFFDNAAFNWPANKDLQQFRCSSEERKATPGRCYAEYTLNIFGANVGGPIKKDKVFFFGMFENNVRDGENFATALVPLATERTPNGTPQGNAIISEWLRLYPLPNRPDINIRRYENNVPFSYSTPNPFGRVDFTIGDATKLMTRYDFRNQDFKITRILEGNGGNIVDRAHTGGAALTHTFASNLVGEFRFGYAYRRIDLPTEVGFEEFPTITISGLSTLGAISNQYPIYRKLYDYQGIGSITWVSGRHSVKTGYDLHRTFNNGIQSDAVRGLIAFSTGYGRTGIQNFLAGTPTSYTVTIGDVERNFRNWDIALFVQDDWRVRDNLTLNLGLRNESVTRWKEKDDKTDFGYDSSPLNLAPRVGAAWDVRGDQQWIVRGAYGMSFDRVNFFFLRSLQFQPPLARTITLLPGTEPLRVENLCPTCGTISSSPPARFDIDPDFDLGKVHTWNVTFEHLIMRNTSVRASYIGSATRGLPASLILNRAVPTADATAANRQQRRPDQTITNWQRLANASDGNYRALQLSLVRRYLAGLQYQFSYTYSRARDLASDVGFGSGDVYLSMQWDADQIFDANDNHDVRHDDMYGPTRFDMRHVWSFNASYELPWRDRPGLVGAVVNDWQISGTAYYRDGYPINVFCGNNGGDCNIDGVAQDRPNVVDASVVGFWFNHKPKSVADTQIQHILPTAFDQNVAPGARGTLGRNRFRTDDYLTVDFAVIRNIDIVRNHRAQVRLEIYDLFNNYYAGAPSLSLATPADFGKISSVAGNRSIQLAFKYLW